MATFALLVCVVGGVTAEYFDVFSQTGQLFLAQLVVCLQMMMMSLFQYSLPYRTEKQFLCMKWRLLLRAFKEIQK